MTDDLRESLAAYESDNAPAVSPDDLHRMAAGELEAPAGWEGPFRLNNDRMAAWAMRKRSEAHARTVEVRQIAEAEHDRIDAWQRDQLRGPGRDVEFFDRLLDDYARGQRAEHDRKSISTPHGTVATRAVKATGKLRDEAALRETLRGVDPALISTVEVIPTVSTLVKDGVLEVTDAGVVLTATGELLPADVVEVIPGRVSVTVTT